MWLWSWDCVSLPGSVIQHKAQLMLCLPLPQVRLSLDSFVVALTCSQVSLPIAVPKQTTSADTDHTADAKLQRQSTCT